jgi:uncharacterized membrane protein
MVASLILAALVSALIQLVQHWFPWRMVLRRETLPRIVAYILGVLGIGLPLSVLFCAWQSWSELLALWIVILVSGLAVILAYAIDWTLDRVRRSYEHEELSRVKTPSDGQQ